MNNNRLTKRVFEYDHGWMSIISKMSIIKIKWIYIYIYVMVIIKYKIITDA